MPACAICNSSQITESRKHEAYTLCDCAACGAEFWWPLKHPGESFYDAPLFRRGRLQWRQKMFLKHPPITKGRVLDIGCGLGNFVVALDRKFPNIEAWGIDIAPNMVEFIKENYGIKNVYAADLKDFLKRTDLPKFDAITMFELIEHVESPNELLQDIKKLLAPGGYVIISTPNMDRLTGIYEDEDLPPHHFWRWHPHTLQFTLERNGFTVTKLVPEPFEKDFIYRWIQKFGWFARFKAWVINTISPKSEIAIHEQKKEERPAMKPIDKKNLSTGDAFVVAKDVAIYIVSLPIIAVARMFGWKYWDMYAEGKMVS
jgi:2-polyprenyl-3-methyl-5-hydroxy-6-metoxy-1,4-benzoquinol methylase